MARDKSSWGVAAAKLTSEPALSELASAREDA
jgi:hypothetical protein